MWWCKRNAAWGRLTPAWGRVARLAVVLAAAGLTAGCFQPLLGTQPSAETESVRDKLAQVDVPVIPAPKGQSASRVAVGLRNSNHFGTAMYFTLMAARGAVLVEDGRDIPGEHGPADHRGCRSLNRRGKKQRKH